MLGSAALRPPHNLVSDTRSFRARLISAVPAELGLAGGVGGDFQAIAAELHAAPAARAFLAGVAEVQHAVLAFADALGISVSEQMGGAVRDGREQILRRVM